MIRSQLIEFKNQKATREVFYRGSYGGIPIIDQHDAPPTFPDGQYWLIDRLAMPEAFPKVNESWVVTWQEQIGHRRYRDDVVKRRAVFDSEALALHKARDLDLEGRKPKVTRERTVTFSSKTSVNYR